MSEFSCPVVRVTIEPHPNADAIEIARIGDYQSIVKKGQFKDGDLAVYIPEQAVVPEWLLKELGFWDAARDKGALNGALGNRVKAIRLRGIVSQGLVLEARMVPALSVGPDDSYDCPIGWDCSTALGITKYEPPIPSHMVGKIAKSVSDAYLMREGEVTEFN